MGDLAVTSCDLIFSAFDISSINFNISQIILDEVGGGIIGLNLFDRA
jgi:hypothetical protein